jgi:hypothetical protein
MLNINTFHRLSTVAPGKTGNLLTEGLLLDYLCRLWKRSRGDMNNDKLIKIIQELLKTDDGLDFLRELKREDLEKLVACIRDRIDRSDSK